MARLRHPDDLTRQQNWRIVAVLVVAGIVVLIVIVNVPKSADSTSSTPTSKPAHSPFEAWIMAQTFVERRLVAPATAKFPGMSEIGVVHRGNGLYEIAGFVDSENTFSAMIRKRFLCKVQWMGADRWHLESLDFISW